MKRLEPVNLPMPTGLHGPFCSPPVKFGEPIVDADLMSVRWFSRRAASVVLGVSAAAIAVIGPPSAGAEPAPAEAPAEAGRESPSLAMAGTDADGVATGVGIFVAGIAATVTARRRGDTRREDEVGCPPTT